MRSISSLRSRTAALTATAGMALTGSLVMFTAPAEAALTETNFGFQATAYGTRALAQQADLTLPRSAFSYISCTRLAGKKSTNSVLDQLGIPLNDTQDLVKINLVRSTTRSFKDLKNKIAGASQSVNTIGSVVVGGIDGGPELSIDGLKTTSTAWATTNGKLHARNNVTAVDLDLDLGGLVPDTGTPLDDLLDAVNSTVGEALDPVIDVLSENLGGIEIPGLGKISLLEGFNRRGVTRTTAYASSFLIRIQLYGQDMEPEGGDDVELNIGRSWARITKGVRSGVMAGVGVGGRETNRGGLGNSGDLAWKQLPCEGTRGRTFVRKVASADFGDLNQATATGLSGVSYGEQLRRGRAVAYTRGRVARFALNGTDLVLEGVVGRTNVRQGSGGGVTTTFAGSKIDRILVNGVVKARDVTPRNAGRVRLGTIPGVEKIRFFVRDTWRRGGSITAAKITLTELAGTSQTDLGFSRAAIKRY